jgi:hypothetical protein
MGKRTTEQWYRVEAIDPSDGHASYAKNVEGLEAAHKEQRRLRREYGYPIVRIVVSTGPDDFGEVRS